MTSWSLHPAIDMELTTSIFKFITTAKLSSKFFGLPMVCLLTAASGCTGVQYDLPFKHERHIAVGISGSNNHVYYWYADRSVSSGTTDNRTQYHGHDASNISASKSLVAVGIAGSNDHVYYWYSTAPGATDRVGIPPSTARRTIKPTRSRGMT